MGEVAIVAEHISKRYWIGKAQSTSFRETINNTLRNLIEGKRTSVTEFWALTDVSFQINKGDAVGIIGRNGAGKSTLLKILSRITVPTKGRSLIDGRIASLLEVGTGFHPELTGRENIFMNGSLLGMKQNEIKKKFDAIVEFSGVEKFIDTPVKYYSSGMYVRLAFAVAAHLEPEILIVDEVLAVGDVEFQKKCLGKMEEVGKQGRTILFVSHNMEAVIRLCNKGILLKNGTISKEGGSREIVNEYFKLNKELIHSSKIKERTDRSGTGKCKFIDAWITDENGEVVNHIHSGKVIQFHAVLEPRNAESYGDYYVTIAICDSKGSRMFGLASGFLNKKIRIEGPTEVIWTIPKFPLAADEYYCNLITFEQLGGIDMADYLEQAFLITVEEGDYFGTGMIQAKGIDRFYTDFNIYSRKL